MVNEQEGNNDYFREFRTSLRHLIDWDRRVINLTCDKCGAQEAVALDGDCRPGDCTNDADSHDGLCEYCGEEGWGYEHGSEQGIWDFLVVAEDNIIILCRTCERKVRADFYNVESESGELLEGLMSMLKDVEAGAAALGIKFHYSMDTIGMVKGKGPIKPKSVELDKEREDR